MVGLNFACLDIRGLDLVFPSPLESGAEWSTATCRYRLLLFTLLALGRDNVDNMLSCYRASPRESRSRRSPVEITKILGHCNCRLFRGVLTSPRFQGSSRISFYFRFLVVQRCTVSPLYIFSLVGSTTIPHKIQMSHGETTDTYMHIGATSYDLPAK